MDAKFKTKRYDLYWIEKQKWELAELKRVVRENELEEKLEAFPKSQMDFHEDAVVWFEVKGIKVDVSEDVKKEKAVAPIKPKKVKKDKSPLSLPSIGLDLDE